MTLSEHLARLATETLSGDVPPAALTAASRMILDSLATTIAGWREPACPEAAKRVATWGGAPEATVLIYGVRGPTPNVAYANSAMCHALDFDDAYFETTMHIMSSVLPVSMAAAELAGASGRQLLDAVILGVEVAGRIGLIIQAAYTGYGFLPASVVGGFGATAAASRLLGLTAHQTAHALGLNYAQTSGNRQALIDTSLAKRIQPALTARSALWAAMLASDGITGPLHALEGDAGLFRLYNRSEPPTPEALMAPYDYWQIEHVSIKPYPCCGGNHRIIQAAIDLANAEDLQPEQIDHAQVWMPLVDVRLLRRPFELGRDPQVQAQFNAAYSAALALLRRRSTLADYRPATITSGQDIIELSRRVDVQVIPGSDTARTHEVAHELIVWTRDGRKLQRRVDLLHGQWQDPLTWDEIADKMRSCAQHAGNWSAERLDALVADVAHLEEVPNVRRWIDDRLVVPGLIA